jgi:hypothetical protein
VPSVTYDGRSFMVDGRRIWLVSGSIHSTRIPRELWEERIWAARLAGLNCIETPVFWNRCEPRPGQFDFTGENDIRHFVELVGKAGMYCILRPGPFVGAQWDMGGLPPWLLSVKNIKLRTANQPFLESCSRYITKLAEQVRDLQITSPGTPLSPHLPGGGPIVLIQNESGWTGGDDKEADGYLGELARYFRESGFSVPTVNSNNLWQGVEGEIDCWTSASPFSTAAAGPFGSSGGSGGGGGGGPAGGDLLGTLRQLATVRPDQPRIVIDLEVGASAVWGGPGIPAEPAGSLLHRLGQVLAAGGQFNISPFCGGTNFGFWGGRLPDQHHAYITASRDHGAPLSETGQPAVSFAAVRRLCTFASRFGRIFANLDPGYRPVAIAPAHESSGDKRRASSPSSPAVTLVHASGPQGSLAMIFAPPMGDAAGEGDRSSADDVRSYSLILADGTSIPVSIGRDGLAWCIFDAYLGGRARLDYCGLSAFAVLGRAFVVFGPAGTEGVLSINGSPLHVTVPKGRSAPAVVEHEGVTVVVCSQEQIDTAYIADDAIFIGASGLTRAGEPIAMPAARQCLRISADGAQKSISAVQPGPTGMPGMMLHLAPSPTSAGGKPHGDKVAISDWMMATMSDYCDGSSARFASIDGPADLAMLGSPYGYGWYRLRLKSPSGGKSRLAIPSGGDRMHLALDGEPLGILGYGPGAAADVPVTLKKGQATLVILAENLGRVAGGVQISESKGVYGDIFQVEPVKAAKPALKTGDPVDVLSFRSPLFEVQPGDITHPERITWTLQHRKKTAIIFSIGSFSGRGLLIVNDKPIAFIERGGGTRHILGADHLRSGTNTVQIAILPERGDQEELEEQLAALSASGAVTFCEAIQSISAGAEWAFAKWEMPRPTAYQKFKPGGARGCPAWWRAHFRPAASQQALLFEAAGLTKGQLYVNDRHVCRYFVATPDGKHIPPQQFYYIPAPWLRPDEENELLIFDEHGGNPSKCRLLYENGRGT